MCARKCIRLFLCGFICKCLKIVCNCVKLLYFKWLLYFSAQVMDARGICCVFEFISGLNYFREFVEVRTFYIGTFQPIQGMYGLGRF